MAIATGIAKRVKYKEEVSWGTIPSAASAQALRRVTSSLTLKKQTYQSQEILSHYQRQDFRHGVRSVEGTIAGELSPATYKDFMAAAVRRAFAAITPSSALSITISGSGPSWTVARAAGSWLTDGEKVGQVGRLTAGGFNAANLNKNLVLLAVTASNLTVMPLNGVALVAEGPIGSATWTPTGKVTFAPASGHTDKSFSIEDWYSDLALSEVFSGCKVQGMKIGLPPSGLATASFDFMGKDLTTAGAEYFTSPTAETSTGILAAVNGLLIAQGGAVALLTGLEINLAGNMTAEPVVGSNTYPDISEGPIVVNGQITALFQDATIRDYFLNETEVAIAAVIAASPAAAASFVGLTVPRIKFGDASPDDGPKSLIRTLPFEALYNSAGGAGTSSEQTTLSIQDSDA